MLIQNNDDSYIFATELKDTFNKQFAIKDDKKNKFDDSIKGRRIVDEMGFGWNFGNIFDAWNGNKQNRGLETEYI